MDRVVNEYFDWLLDFVCVSNERELYSELLANLYNTEFKWTIELDENRASWGIALRNEFIDEYFDRSNGLWVRNILTGPCNMLELMVSLSRQIDNVLYDDAYGTRFDRWFWMMIDNLGVRMTNNSFDDGIFNEKMDIFMNRDFEPDGFGSLFWIPGCKFDCRRVQIWVQKCKFESNFVKNEEA